MMVKINIPYTCTRCGLTTIKKNDMKRHFFDRKKSCPAIKNNIELTDDIKNHILENRVYIIPKENKKTQNDKLTKYNTNKGFVYMFYTRASKNTNEYVYKTGKSHDYNQRKAGYMKGGDMLFVMNVKDRHLCENIVLAHFNREFIHRADYGREFFEGDIFEMVMLMKTILKDQMEEIIIDFDF